MELILKCDTGSKNKNIFIAEALSLLLFMVRDGRCYTKLGYSFPCHIIFRDVQEPLN